MTLRTNQLTITHGKKILCQPFTWKMHAGEIWGLLGANGRGKTTLLHTLAALRKTQHGDIFMNEKNMHTLCRKQIAKQVGILFQDVNVSFPQTVFDYCLASRFPHLPYFKRENDADKQLVMHALETMSLLDRSQTLMEHLSGGEKRRASLAAIFAQNPAIYLLDEPTNHLDLRFQMQTMKHIRSLATNQSASVLMSLHDVNLAQQFCDHILLLFDEGEIMQGTTKDLLTEKNLTRLYQQPLQRLEVDGSVFWAMV